MSDRLRQFRLLLVCAALCGCQASFVESRAAAAATRTERGEAWSHFFFFGLVGSSDYDARGWCGHGRLRSVILSGTPTTVGVSVITLGIYVPRRVAWVCTRDGERR